MAARSQTIDEFLGLLRRRLRLWRCLEGAAIGVLGACGAAVPAIAALLWEGRPALIVVASLLLLGAIWGFLWGSTRIPSDLSVAQAVDRTFGLDDLLSTAVALPRTFETSISWQNSILARAEIRCSGLAAAAIPAHRLQGQAWAGIGLAVILVLLGTSIDVPHNREGTAESVDTAGRRASVSTERLEVIPAAQGLSLLPAIHARQRPPEPGEETVADNGDAAPEQRGTKPGTGSTGNSQTASSDGADSGGSGNGNASSRAEVISRPRPAAGHELSDAAGGKIDSGGNAAGRASDPGGIDATGRTASRDVGGSIPLWRTDHWPGDVQQARAMLDAGAIPAGYQDLVRSYFDNSGY